MKSVRWRAISSAHYKEYKKYSRKFGEDAKSDELYMRYYNASENISEENKYKLSMKNTICLDKEINYLSGKQFDTKSYTSTFSEYPEYICIQQKVKNQFLGLFYKDLEKTSLKFTEMAEGDLFIKSVCLTAMHKLSKNPGNKEVLMESYDIISEIKYKNKNFVFNHENINYLNGIYFSIVKNKLKNKTVTLGAFQPKT